MLEIVSNLEEITVKMDGSLSEIMTELTVAAHNIIQMATKENGLQHKAVLKVFYEGLIDIADGKYKVTQPEEEPA